MNIEFITKEDFENFKNEIIKVIKSANQNNAPKKYLRSAEVRDMFNISAGTLQQNRINGSIPYTKLGSTIFYDYDELIKILNENKIVN